MRKPLYLHASRRSDRSHDRANDVAQVFSNQIDDSLGDRLFKGEFSQRIGDAEVSAYVTEREWLEESLTGQQLPATYEDQLHARLSPDGNEQKPLILLLAGEGVGKSTILRYYFDFFAPGKMDVGSWVVLYADLRYERTGNDAIRSIHKVFRQQLEDRFPELAVENDFAMWDRRARWDKPYHTQASKGRSRGVYRSEYVREFHQDDAAFVEEALWYLEQRGRQGGPRSHVFMIFDNLDQLQQATQLDVLRLVLKWIGRGETAGAVWKAVLPLRPETLRQLAGDLDPIDHKRIVRLGEVNRSLMVEARASLLGESVNHTEIQVERDRVMPAQQGDVSSLMYDPLNTWEAAEYLRKFAKIEMPIDGANSMDPSRIGVRARRTTGLVDDYCNGSLRRYLGIRRRVCRNRHLDAETATSLGHYEYIDAWCNAGRDRFTSPDTDSTLINLYNVLEELDGSAYSLLIGLHLLYACAGGRVWDRTELGRRLTILGYEDVEISGGLQALVAGRIISREAHGDSERLHPTMRIIRAYTELATHPAYLDSMAVVTPVEMKFLSAMTHTVGYVHLDLRARISTGLAFLRQLREDERQFVQWSVLGSERRRSASQREFVECGDQLRLPCFHKRAAYEYRNRIDGLKKRRPGLKKYLSEAEFDQFLRDEILAVSYHDKDALLNFAESNHS